ncbi:MAG: hypothetical protein ABSF37_00815 [Sedimentisphaerales bacterium]|jgi:hypothetical protein
MGKSKAWTIKRIAFWTLILTAAAVFVAVLQYFKNTEGNVTVHSKNGVTVVGDNANLTVDQRTGIDPNEYRSLAEEKGRTDEKIAKLKEEMREIDATKHDDLLKRYSLGYILFYIDHTNMVIPYESHIKTECAVDISESKVVYIGEKGIDIELPNIECKGGPTIIECICGIKREIGQQTPIFGHFHGIQMYSEMLVDHGDSFVCVLGFATYPPMDRKEKS